MVIDSSALLAVLLAERDAKRFARAIELADARRISAASWLEASLVIDNRGSALASRDFDLFIRRAGIIVEPVTIEQAQIARQAYLDSGKGRHPAALDFGVCLSYALAKSLDEPLLFKGDDFARTDVERARS